MLEEVKIGVGSLYLQPISYSIGFLIKIKIPDPFMRPLYSFISIPFLIFSIHQVPLGDKNRQG